MRVHEIMSTPALACRADAPLAEVARVMSERECGIVPLTSADGRRVVGVVTDRDMCMAAFRLQAPLSNIEAAAAMSKQLHCCKPDDDVAHALELMRRHRVRRLPVLDAQGQLLGIMSLDDVARVASAAGRGTNYLDVCGTLRAITIPRPCRTPGSTEEGEATRLYADPCVE